MKRIAGPVSILAALLLVVALMGWMTAQVAEYPGVPRAVGELPPWFAGEPIGAREKKDALSAGSPAAPGAQPRQAHAPSRPGEVAVPAADFVKVAGGEIEIALTEYEMKPDKIRVGPGTVTFVLRNKGRFAHNFHVEGPGVDAHAEKFSPGTSMRLEVALQEGEYKLSCPLSNHDQRGMHGTLIASSKPGG